MGKNRKKPVTGKRRVPPHEKDAPHSDNGIGLPEDVRVVFGEEHNPDDG